MLRRIEQPIYFIALLPVATHKTIVLGKITHFQQETQDKEIFRSRWMQQSLILRHSSEGKKLSINAVRFLSLLCNESGKPMTKRNIDRGNGIELMLKIC